MLETAPVAWVQSYVPVGNLFVSALHGFIYIFAAWQCGKFAQRRGLLTSLKVCLPPSSMRAIRIL